jgi:hypothetical protein
MQLIDWANTPRVQDWTPVGGAHGPLCCVAHGRRPYQRAPTTELTVRFDGHHSWSKRRPRGNDREYLCGNKLRPVLAVRVPNFYDNPLRSAGQRLGCRKVSIKQCDGHVESSFAACGDLARHSRCASKVRCALCGRLLSGTVGQLIPAMNSGARPGLLTRTPTTTLSQFGSSRIRVKLFSTALNSCTSREAIGPRSPYTPPYTSCSLARDPCRRKATTFHTKLAAPAVPPRTPSHNGVSAIRSPPDGREPPTSSHLARRPQPVRVLTRVPVHGGMVFPAAERPVAVVLHRREALEDRGLGR